PAVRPGGRRRGRDAGVPSRGGRAPRPGGRHPGARRLRALSARPAGATETPQVGPATGRYPSGMGTEAWFSVAFGVALGTFVTAAVLWLHERHDRKVLEDVSAR